MGRAIDYASEGLQEPKLPEGVFEEIWEEIETRHEFSSLDDAGSSMAYRQNQIIVDRAAFIAK